VKRLALIALPALAALVAAAVATSGNALPARGTLLGGGAVTPGYNPTGGYGLGFVSLAVAHRDGRTVVFYGDWNGNCPGYAGPVTATFVQRVAIRPDGSFSGSGAVPSTVAVGTFSFEGHFTGPAGAEGTGRVVFKYKPGNVTYSCDTGKVTWQARADAGASGKPRPKPNGTYFGGTSQTLPIVLNLTPDGTAIAQAALLWNVQCQRNKSGIGRGTVSPPVSLDRGSFSATSQYDDLGIQPGVIAHVTSARSGRFGAVSATGTWRIHIELRTSANNQLIDVCDSGLVRWHASL
jgi:hypothetical protein